MIGNIPELNDPANYSNRNGNYPNASYNGFTKDIWPNQSTSLRAGNETTDVLVMKYKAREHQRNLDPDSLWVGITTSLYSGDYDQIQSKFFEIWVSHFSVIIVVGPFSLRIIFNINSYIFCISNYKRKKYNFL